MTNPNIIFTAPNVAEVIDKPVPAPGPGQVLVRTVRTCISSGTARANLIGDPMVGTDVKDGAPAVFPRQAGYSSSGVVEAVGEGVASVKPGDHVAAGWTKHAAFNVVTERRAYRRSRRSLTRKHLQFNKFCNLFCHLCLHLLTIGIYTNFY